ncbi:MAG: 50S ribosomal protein L6 [Deinococcales bacterium]
MSRIGRAPISIPKGVEVKFNKGSVSVKGAKGVLEVPVNDRLELAQENGAITLKRQSDNRFDRSQHGLTRTLINNAIIGVTQGYKRNLEIHGVGYRVAMKGKSLELTLGFSHPVVIDPPEGINFETPDQTKIVVSGIDKQLVGQVCANLREIRPPDSYHGKGVRYEGEQLRLKPGKAAGK